MKRPVRLRNNTSRTQRGRGPGRHQTKHPQGRPRRGRAGRMLEPWTQAWGPVVGAGHTSCLQGKGSEVYALKELCVWGQAEAGRWGGAPYRRGRERNEDKQGVARLLQKSAADRIQLSLPETLSIRETALRRRGSCGLPRTRNPGHGHRERRERTPI